MKIIIDRAEIDKAIEDLKHDGNIDSDFTRAKVDMNALKQEVLESEIGDEQEQQKILREAIIELYGDQ